MTLTKEDLEAIGKLVDESLEEKLTPIRTDIHFIKSDIEVFKTDVSQVKFDAAALKHEIAAVKIDVASLQRWRTEMQMRVH